jgi:hypothetical protein
MTAVTASIILRTPYTTNYIRSPRLFQDRFINSTEWFRGTARQTGPARKARDCPASAALKPPDSPAAFLDSGNGHAVLVGFGARHGWPSESSLNNALSASIWAVSRDVAYPTFIGVSPRKTRHSHRSGSRAKSWTSSSRNPRGLPTQRICASEYPFSSL